MSCIARDICHVKFVGVQMHVCIKVNKCTWFLYLVLGCRPVRLQLTQKGL